MRKLKAYDQARQTHVIQNAVLTNQLVDFKADGASAATSDACWTKACRCCHWVTFAVSIAGAFTDAASDTTAGGLANLSSLVAISVSAKKQTNADKKWSGHAEFAKYLDLARLPGAAELTVFCGAMTGASLGFLWYNAHPAEIFMGDVGSGALGIPGSLPAAGKSSDPAAKNTRWPTRGNHGL